jgi:hypothetical protein
MSQNRGQCIQARLRVCTGELWVLLKHVLNRIASGEEFQNGLNRDAGDPFFFLFL